MADNTAAEESEQQITFTIKSSADAKYVLTLPVSTTIADVKQKLSTSEYADLPPERQRLIYSGRVLKDGDTITSCKIKDGNTVHMVKGAESNSRQNPANQGGSAAASTTPGAGQPANNVPSNIAAGPGSGNPLAQLTGARYAGFHGLPGMDTFGADGGMGAPPNPDQMLRLLDDPNFAQQMNEAMNNPQVVEMLRNNPMIRNNPMARQAIENPELRRMMMNPEMIRMQMQMQRAMGGAGGAAGGEGAFPMPGQTDTTQPSSTDSMTGTPDTTTPASNNTAANTASNPFAALFPGGGAGTGGQQPGTNQTGNQNNPFQAMTEQLMQNPDMMRQAMQAMQGMQGMGGMGGMGGGAGGAEAGTGAGAGGMGGFNPFMFGGMPGGGGDFGGSQQPQAPADDRPPEDRFADQLRQLNDMGFHDFDRNVTALRRTGGSVQGAVEYLLTSP